MNSQDTIAALSSASVAAGRAGVSIIRLSGPDSFSAISRFFPNFRIPPRLGILQATVNIEGLTAAVCLYVFPSPHSYTGQDMVELHLPAVGAVVEVLYKKLSGCVRQAGPGSYAAGVSERPDGSDGSRAVAQIISGSNAARIAAAEKLLAGNLSAPRRYAASDPRLLSQLEAGLDFADERSNLSASNRRPASVADGSAGGSSGQYDFYMSMIDLPSVGLPGLSMPASRCLTPCKERPQHRQFLRRYDTRCAGGGLSWAMDCVLFDCAGLGTEAADDPLDALARQAARSALAGADAMLFCVDIGKEDLTDDRAVYALLAGRPFLAIATQCDRVGGDSMSGRLERLHRTFGCAFLPTSACSGMGLDALKAGLGDLWQLFVRGDGGDRHCRQSTASATRRNRCVAG